MTAAADRVSVSGTVLGLVVNPVAGLGGPAALKGTDGAAAVQRALAAGSVPHAGERATRALRILAEARTRAAGAGSARTASPALLVGPGALGADAAAAAGLDAEVLPLTVTGTGDDTTALSARLVARGVDLILFCGGDGTARDVAAGVGDSGIPVLGIPAGVKMYSGCFAVSPEAAGGVALDLAGRGVHEVEVLDVDEDQVRTGRVDPRLFALVNVPDDASRVQGRKVATQTSQADAVAAVARGLAEELRPGVTYLVGPGGTTAALMRRLGLDHTPLGVDVVRDGAVVALDVDEATALKVLAQAPGPARAVVTIIGGQGFLLGRGNQQLSAKVLRALRVAAPDGAGPLLVGATQEKLIGLSGRPLLVDTGDVGLDHEMSGPVRIVTGPRTQAAYRAVAAEES